MSNTPKPQANKTIDELERDIAIEVGIVYKHSKLGTDYTVNCTNAILSLCEHYSEALATEAEDKAMAKFGLKRGVKYDIQASDKVIVIYPAKGEQVDKNSIVVTR